jgi:hypothetical protein
MLTLSAMLTSTSPTSIALKALAYPVAAISCKLLELAAILCQLDSSQKLSHFEMAPWVQVNYHSEIFALPT